jgi:hypothetical protein
MITFAFLGNTLFLTILVSMLTNTFSLIAANTTAELQFRRAVLTFEGVKSDAIFAYMPPFNILSLIFILPMKLVLGDRGFHKLNVYATRTLNAPLLLLISLWERRTLWRQHSKTHYLHSIRSIDWKRAGGPKPMGVGAWAKTMTFWDFSRFSVHGDIQAVFETEPPQSVLDEIAEEDDIHHQAPNKALHAALDDQFPTAASPKRSPDHSPSRSKAKHRSAGPVKRRLSSIDVDLMPEFRSPSDEEDIQHAQQRDPHGSTKKSRARMDSIVDYGPGGSAMDEANTRLHKLEAAVNRIEEMLTKLVNDPDGGDGNDEDGLKS